MPRGAFGFALLLIAGCRDPLPAAEPDAPAARAAPAEPSPYLKVQLHAHSGASGDSETPPQEVVRWYAEHDFDVLVFTDHNRITQIDGTETLLAAPGVELTANPERCIPPPPDPRMQCPLHTNVLFVDPTAAARINLPHGEELDRFDVYARELDAARSLGGIAMLNHPNFHYGADVELIARLADKGLKLVEIFNLAVDSNNGGDADHPSTEKLWDTLLSRGIPIWATATDDAHHYYDAKQVALRGELAHTGNRGFVMVRAERSPAAVKAALQAGDFYASSGVLLDRVEVEGGALRVRVDPRSPGDHTFVFIGHGGAQLRRQTGRQAAQPLDPQGSYVRAVVTDDDGRSAWTQPVWVSRP